MSLRYLSVCSGIEAATVAWHHLAWQPVGFAEIEAFPSAVLRQHYPTVPNLGDLTQFGTWPHDLAPDLIVGGTPCQSFSVAGLRKGLADPRGNLTLVFLALVERYQPEWVVWENVPGVLSSGGGRDFGAFLGGLAELGYGWAYRILDAQYFGVAQRRRRVFVVAHARGWQRAAAVLFERHSVSGHPAPRREARQGITRSIDAGAQGGGGLGTDVEPDGKLIALTGDVASCLETTCHEWSRADGFTMHKGINTTLDEGQTPVLAHAFDARQSDVLQYGDQGGPLDTDGHSVAIAFDAYNQSTADITHILRRGTGASSDAIPQTLALRVLQAPAPTTAHVRRLTPRECERLQGFPDDYTLITYRGKPASDGPRYKALGNSMAVPVMRWIGERVAAVSAIPREACA